MKNRKKASFIVALSIMISLLSPGFIVNADDYGYDAYDSNLETNYWDTGYSESESWYMQPTNRDVYSGDISLYAKKTVSGWYDNDIRQFTSSEITAGNKYLATFYVKISAPTNMWVLVNDKGPASLADVKWFMDNGGTARVTEAGNGWTKYEYIITPTVTGQKFMFKLYGGECYIDDVSLKPIISIGEGGTVAEITALGDEMIVNGDFEQSYYTSKPFAYESSAWGFINASEGKSFTDHSDTNYVEPTDLMAYHGKLSLLIKSPTAYGEGTTDPYVRYVQNLTFQPDKKYEISFYAKGLTTGNGVVLNIPGRGAWGLPHDIIAAGESENAERGWTKYIVRIAEGNTAYALNLILKGGVTGYYIDNFSVKEYTEDENGNKTYGENLIKDGSFENSINIRKNDSLTNFGAWYEVTQDSEQSFVKPIADIAYQGDFSYLMSNGRGNTSTSTTEGMYVKYNAGTTYTISFYAKGVYDESNVFVGLGETKTALSDMTKENVGNWFKYTGTITPSSTYSSYVSAPTGAEGLILQNTGEGFIIFDDFSLKDSNGSEKLTDVSHDQSFEWFTGYENYTDEVNVSDWVEKTPLEDGSSFTKVSDLISYEGDFSLMIRDQTPSGGASYINQSTTIPAGTYTISMYVKMYHPSSANMDIWLRGVEEDGSIGLLWYSRWNAFETQVDMGNNWKYYETTAELSGSITDIQLMSYGVSHSYIDNFSIKDADGKEYVKNGGFENAAKIAEDVVTTYDVSNMPYYTKLECDMYLDTDFLTANTIEFADSSDTATAFTITDFYIQSAQNTTPTNLSSGWYNVKLLFDHFATNAFITVTTPDGKEIQRADPRYILSIKPFSTFTIKSNKNTVKNVKINIADESDLPTWLSKTSIRIINDSADVIDWNMVPVTANSIIINMGTSLLDANSVANAVYVKNAKTNEKIATSTTTYKYNDCTITFSENLEPDTEYVICIDDTLATNSGNTLPNGYEFKFKTIKSVAAEIESITKDSDEINALTQLKSNDVVTVTLDYNSVFGGAENYFVIAAYYGLEGELISTQEIHSEVVASGTLEDTYTYDMTIGDLTNVGEIRLFVWDSYNGLIPVGNVYAIR